MIRQTREETVNRAKAERKAKREAEKVKVAKLAERRRSKEVNVNRLTSISGGAGRNEVVCHACGQKGHMRKDCPDRTEKRKSEFDENWSRKKPKKADVLDY